MARTPKLPRFLDKDNPLEKKIEKDVCDFGASLGLKDRKYANPMRRAAPDRIFWRLRPGREPYVFFVEFKSKGKVPTPAQLDEHTALRDDGFEVFVIDNIEAGKDLMRVMA